MSPNEKFESSEDRGARLEASGYISFSDLPRPEGFSIQDQYLDYYASGIGGRYPNLGEGLRLDFDKQNYHQDYIHKDDVNELFNRIMKAQGLIK